MRWSSEVLVDGHFEFVHPVGPLNRCSQTRTLLQTSDPFWQNGIGVGSDPSHIEVGPSHVIGAPGVGIWRVVSSNSSIAGSSKLETKRRSGAGSGSGKNG